LTGENNIISRVIGDRYRHQHRFSCEILRLIHPNVHTQLRMRCGKRYHADNNAQKLGKHTAHVNHLTAATHAVKPSVQKSAETHAKKPPA
jgi:hypothetical protein